MRFAVSILAVSVVVGACAPEGRCGGIHGAINTLAQLYPARIVLIGTVVEGESQDSLGQGDWRPSYIEVLAQPWQFNDSMPSHVGRIVTVLVRSPPTVELGRTYAFYARPDAMRPTDVFHSRLAVDVETDSPLNDSPLIAAEVGQATAHTGGTVVDAVVEITAEQASRAGGASTVLAGPVSEATFSGLLNEGCP